jgi:apolipoprotein D and lipocalin family protein
MKRSVSAMTFILLLLLGGCVHTPEGIEPVSGFEQQRYLGKWYEIARLDHSFERGLSNVTADYSLREDGDIRVINRGYRDKSGEWEAAEGRAKFLNGPDIASLKVSFFGPFYGGYHVIELDRKNYSYAMVAGNDRDYLWILARSPVLAPNVRQRLTDRAKALGYETDALIFVDQVRNR